jgi:hypothetical protein
MSWFKLYYKELQDGIDKELQDGIEKKLHSSLEQCPVKTNRKKHSEVSILLYSINQFCLIKEKNYFNKIYLTKNEI